VFILIGAHELAFELKNENVKQNMRNSLVYFFVNNKVMAYTYSQSYLVIFYKTNNSVQSKCVGISYVNT